MAVKFELVKQFKVIDQNNILHVLIKNCLTYRNFNAIFEFLKAICFKILMIFQTSVDW